MWRLIDGFYARVERDGLGPSMSRMNSNDGPVHLETYRLCDRLGHVRIHQKQER
jgi:hypothetical protein